MTSAAVPPQAESAARPIPARIPFLTTSFAADLWWYALLWPVWWLLGIEQILLPFFLGWEFLRQFIRSRARLRFNATATWALLLALWWVAPVIWVDREFLDIFLKETATAWSQFAILFLFWNAVHTRRDWNRVVGAAVTIAVYVSLGGLIFLSGLWQGEILSVFGRFLPASLIESSTFFSSIAIRTFGETEAQGSLLANRVSSFALNFSGLSMISLLLLPLMVWRLEHGRGIRRLVYLGTILGLLVCLTFAESRISYVALIAGVGMYVVLRFGLLRGENKPLSIAVGLIGAAALALFGYLALSALSEALRTVFVDWRPGSWLVRFRIYEETIRLLPQHPIAGWGAPVRIPGAPNNYSAGTHSSYLGMLFQHGAVGLFLYLGMWASIWMKVVRGFREPGRPYVEYSFWMFMAAAFFAFNIRETADTWWWDQLVTFTVWLMWGLTQTASRVFHYPEGAVHDAGTES